jgi:hypothetical protein
MHKKSLTWLSILSALILGAALQADARGRQPDENQTESDPTTQAPARGSSSDPAGTGEASGSYGESSGNTGTGETPGATGTSGTSGTGASDAGAPSSTGSR